MDDLSVITGGGEPDANQFQLGELVGVLGLPPYLAGGLRLGGNGNRLDDVGFPAPPGTVPGHMPRGNVPPSAPALWRGFLMCRLCTAAYAVDAGASFQTGNKSGIRRDLFLQGHVVGQQRDDGLDLVWRGLRGVNGDLDLRTRF